VDDAVATSGRGSGAAVAGGGYSCVAVVLVVVVAVVGGFGATDDDDVVTVFVVVGLDARFVSDIGTTPDRRMVAFLLILWLSPTTTSPHTNQIVLQKNKTSLSRYAQYQCNKTQTYLGYKEEIE
jgi:hypothetical protein